MNDTRKTKAPAEENRETQAPERPGRLVGVVRVLRGRMAAPCRCCCEASARAAEQERTDP